MHLLSGNAHIMMQWHFNQLLQQPLQYMHIAHDALVSKFKHATVHSELSSCRISPFHAFEGCVSLQPNPIINPNSLWNALWYCTKLPRSETWTSCAGAFRRSLHGNEARKVSRANFVASFPGHDPVSGLGSRLLPRIVSGICCYEPARVANVKRQAKT